MTKNWSWRGRANEATYQITLFACHRLHPVVLRSVDGSQAMCKRASRTCDGHPQCASEWSAAVQRANRLPGPLAVCLGFASGRCDDGLKTRGRACRSLSTSHGSNSLASFFAIRDSRSRKSPWHCSTRTRTHSRAHFETGRSALPRHGGQIPLPTDNRKGP
jgi:hypothetical protein